MNSIIGYAIFKKTTNLIVESNGLFEQLNLGRSLIIDESIINLEVGEQLLFFKRIASKIKKPNKRDAYLVVLLEKTNLDNKDFIIGSAICFKEFTVNAEKIINGVLYLLNQLKNNFKSDYDFEDKNLDIVLPSPNKNFGIFNTQKLTYVNVKYYFKGLQKVNYLNISAKKYLSLFCKHSSLSKIEYLFLTKDKSVVDKLLTNNIKLLNLDKLLVKKEVSNKETIAPNTVEVDQIKKERDQIKKELEKVKSQKNNSKNNGLKIIGYLVSLIFIIGISIFGYLYKTGYFNSYTRIEKFFYVNVKYYNANVRTGTSTKFSIENTLSNGDKVFVIEQDKETKWMKIKYNNDKSTGYISDKLISKNKPNNVSIINKKATIKWYYTKLYNFPKVKKNKPEMLFVLNKSDEIFVKSHDKKSKWYSVSFTKNGKFYNGYIQGNDFNFK